jgi:DNA-binding NarL/FixJ family response regulator
MSKEIADRLFISVNTVNTHRQRILEKLGAESSIEAIRYAKEKGILGF